MQLRQRQGWDRIELADRLGISLERLKKWEQGVNLPTLDMIEPLARTLGVSIDELVTGEPAPAQRIPPAQRSEVTMCLNGLLRAMRPLLQPGEEKKRKE